ncbi:DUF3703 domain-containing protein [Pseudomonas laurylsulfativorans]
MSLNRSDGFFTSALRVPAYAEVEDWLLADSAGYDYSGSKSEVGMKEILRTAINEAFLEASAARKNNDVQAAYLWLERAHIIAQRMPLAHARSHWLMLKLGLQTRDWREVVGQVPRIFAALLFSRIWVPVGNTGRARVSAFSVMPLSADLQELLRDD